MDPGALRLSGGGTPERPGPGRGPEGRFRCHRPPFPGLESHPGGEPGGYRSTQYVGGIGEEGLEALKAFAREGGTLLFHEGSSELALQAFDLPLVEVSEAAREAGFYSAGSILKLSWDADSPLTRGMDSDGVAFVTSRAFLFEITGEGSGIVGRPRVVGSFPKEGPLLVSGYLEGEEAILGQSPVVEVPYGEGRLVLVGFSLHNRAQMVANFKLLFNAIAGSLRSG